MGRRRLSVSMLKPGMITADHVFTARGRKLVEDGVELDSELIRLFVNFRIDSVVIEEKEEPKVVEEPVQDYKFSNTAGLAEEGGRRIAKMDSPRAKEAHRISVERTGKVFSQIKDGGSLDLSDAQETVSNLLENVLVNPHAFASLKNLRTKDEYTYTHSVDTATLAILLGGALKITGDDLKELVLAALLHDVGKMLVPDAVLNKPGPYNDIERKQMNKHAFFGYEILKRENVSERTANCVLEHHEKMDASGYPFGKRGIDLDEFSRIISICDVYSAITTDRSYRKAMPAFKAVKAVATMSGTHLDRDFTREFQKMIGVYPNGTIVRTSVGEVARVIEQNKALPMRPILQILVAANGEKMTEVKSLDLSLRKDVFIKSVAS